MTILIIGSYSPSLINFRGDLIQAMCRLGHDVYAAAPDESEYVNEILNGWGVKYISVPMDRTGMSIHKDAFTLWSLFRVIKRIKPDIVLSYTIKPVLYGSIAAGICNVKRVFSMITGLGWLFNDDNNGKNSYLRKTVEALYRYAASRNNAFIFQNPDDQSSFIKKKIITPEKTFRVHGSGVNTSLFIYSPPPINPLRFLFIGRLVKEKGLLEFIKASSYLKQRYPEVLFEIVGGLDSNPGSITRQYFDYLNSENSVLLHGHVDDVRPYLLSASVFTLPSYSEGTPRTALEAMSTGRPLVMTDSPGCRETVINGENGFLVPVKDSTALAAAMEKFIVNPSLIEPMGKRSRQIAEDLYDVNKVNADILWIMGLNT